jgi:type II secretory pathway component PulM
VSLAIWIVIAIVVLAVLLLLVVLVRLVGPMRRLQTQVVTLQSKLGDVEALQARVEEVNAAMSVLQARAAAMSNQPEPANERPVGADSAETRGSAA